MADIQLKNLNEITNTSQLTSTKNLLIFDNSTNAGNRISLTTLANSISDQTITGLAGANQSLKTAIDALNSKLTLTGEYNSAESFSSAETLGSQLDALLNAQDTYVIGCYRLACTASFGVFQNGYDYYVQMARASSLNFVIAEFTPIDNGLIKILGKRRNEGWSFELAPSRTEINTLNSRIVCENIMANSSLKKSYNTGAVVFAGRGVISTTAAIAFCDAWSYAVNISSNSNYPISVSNKEITIQNNTDSACTCIILLL